MPEDASEEAPSRAREARDRGLLVRLVVLGAALIAALALLSVLLLRPPRVRENPHRDDCASNLRLIGLSIRQYAEDHGGAFPPSFTELYSSYVENAECFSCPGQYCMPTKPSQWQDIQRTGEVTPASTSYVYVSGLRATDASACVLAFDRPGNHGGEGVHVLFLDTHVEFDTIESGMLEHYLAETRKRIEAKSRRIKFLYEKVPPRSSSRPAARWPYWLPAGLAAGLVLVLALVLRRRRRPARA